MRKASSANSSMSSDMLVLQEGIKLNLVSSTMLAHDKWKINRSSHPFDHITIDNFLHEDVAKCIASDFPPYSFSELRPYDNPLEHKKLLNHWDKFTPAIYKLITYLNSSEFISVVESLVDVGCLHPDNGLNGAGLFLHTKGGHLNPHLDYRIHPKLGLERRYSLLIYLTEDWDPKWGGDFVMYSGSKDSLIEEKRIGCIFNRVLLFDTTQNSWHGVPEPLDCPVTVTRKAIGLFYLSQPRAGIPISYKASYSLLGEDVQDSRLQEFVALRSNKYTCRDAYEAGKLS